MKRVVLDIETNGLLEQMLNFGTMPLSLKDTARLWCVVLVDADDTKNYRMFVPEEHLETLRTDPVFPERYRYLAEPYKKSIPASAFSAYDKYHQDVAAYNEEKAKLEEALEATKVELGEAKEVVKDLVEGTKGTKGKFAKVASKQRLYDKALENLAKLEVPTHSLDKGTYEYLESIQDTIEPYEDYAEGYKQIDRFVAKYREWQQLESLDIEVLTKDALKDALADCEELIFHNGIKFDAPALQVFGMLDYKVGYLDTYGDGSDHESVSTIYGKPCEITDTLLWSKMLNPDRFGGHSLANLSKHGETQKLDFNDFSHISVGMLVYCLFDVRSNAEVYHMLRGEESRLPGGIFKKPYLMEAKLADLAFKQELRGFHYNVELSESFKSELDTLLKERANIINPVLPPRPLKKSEEKYYTPPANKWSKTSNTLSKHMLAFLEKLGAEFDPLSSTYTYEGKTYPLDWDKPLIEQLPATVKDLAHLKTYLMSLGWKPTQWGVRDLTKGPDKRTRGLEDFKAAAARYAKSTFEGGFTEARLAEIGVPDNVQCRDTLNNYFVSEYTKNPNKPIKVPTSPALRVGTTKELCPNLVALDQEGIVEFVNTVVEYYTYQHRRGAIGGYSAEEIQEQELDSNDLELTAGFEKFVRTNHTIPTILDTVGTNTSRMKHRVVCNIPKVSVLYGKLRELFTSGPDHLLFGFDFASLEARAMGHYVMGYEHGPELAAAMLAPKGQDIHCYSEDTEILTTEGWKLFGDLSFESKVAQYDKDSGLVSFVKPEDIVWQPYEGDMVHFSNRSTDMLVTPNHRVLYRPLNSKNYSIKPALDVTKLTSQLQYPCAGLLRTGQQSEPQEFYELLFAIQADGYLHKDCSAISLSFVKGQKIERVEMLLEEIGISYSKHSHIRKGRSETTFRLSAKDPGTLKLRSFFTDSKTLILDVFSLPLEVRLHILETIPLWDGTRTIRGDVVLDTTDNMLIDLLQGLCSVSGVKSVKNFYTKRTTFGEVGVYRLYYSKSSKNKVEKSMKRASSTVHYSGMIGCVSVPTGLVVVRRNGKVFVSGNTLNAQKLGISRDMAKSISYGCLPTANTEVLTAKGWRHYNQLSVGDVVYSQDEYGDLVEDKILKLHFYPNAYVQRYTYEQFDFVCTADHRWKSPRGYRQAQFLTKGRNLNISAELHGNSDLSLPHIRLAAWFIALGYTLKTSESNTICGIAPISSSHLRELIRDFKAVGIGYEVFFRTVNFDHIRNTKLVRDHTLPTYRLDLADTKRFFDELGMESLDVEQNVWLPLVLSLSVEQREVFIESFYKATGGIVKNTGRAYNVLSTALYLQGRRVVVRPLDGVKDNRVYFDVYHDPNYYIADLMESRDMPNTDVFCITTKNSNFVIRQDFYKMAITGNCLYGAQPPKLQAMLGITRAEADKLFNDYWDAVPALKAVKADLEIEWAQLQSKYIEGFDGRYLSTRSKHSLLNVLFQSAGSFVTKYTMHRLSQLLEMQGALGDPLLDTYEESKSKCYQLIIYHDEAQMSMPINWYKPMIFESEEEAEAYKKANNLFTPVHFSDKMGKFYLDGTNRLSDLVLQAVDDASKYLGSTAEMGIEYSVGRNWADTH